MRLVAGVLREPVFKDNEGYFVDIKFWFLKVFHANPSRWTYPWLSYTCKTVWFSCSTVQQSQPDFCVNKQRHPCRFPLEVNIWYVCMTKKHNEFLHWKTPNTPENHKRSHWRTVRTLKKAAETYRPQTKSCADQNHTTWEVLLTRNVCKWTCRAHSGLSRHISSGCWEAVFCPKRFTFKTRLFCDSTFVLAIWIWVSFSIPCQNDHGALGWLLCHCEIFPILPQQCVDRPLKHKRFIRQRNRLKCMHVELRDVRTANSFENEDVEVDKNTKDEFHCHKIISQRVSD